MYFRPLPVMSLFALVALALLVTLGVWQLHRMDEKAAAVALYEAGSAGPPISLTEAVCGPGTLRYGQRIEMPDETRGRPLFYFGRNESGRPGWRIFETVRSPSCSPVAVVSHVLVETGFRVDREGDTAITGPLTLARPPHGTIFDAPSDLELGRFYNFNAEEMAAWLDVPEVSEDIWLTSRFSGLPPSLAQTPPARHLGYALTWFGFALTLIGVYIAFHVSRQRLGFTRR